MSREAFNRAADRAVDTAVRELELELGRPSGYAEISPHEIACPRCGQVVHQIEDTSDQRSRSFNRLARYAPCRCVSEIAEQTRKAFTEREWWGWVERKWQASPIPPRFRNATFASFQVRPGTEAAVKACKEYARSFEPGATTTGLYLFGLFGSGKTHLAVATARAIVERTLITVTFKSVVSLLSEVKANFGRRREDDDDDECQGEGAPRRSDPIADAKGAELLILDDLGQEYGTEFERSVIAEIICHRYDECLPTIYTSNLGDAQLKDRLGGAPVSRLWESTKGLQLGATDFRKEIAKR